MRYIIPCILLALTTCLYADEPKSKAIRKYENEVEVLRKQGQAAIKRLEGVFEKEVEKLREKTLKALQEELDAALEAKDLDASVALREAIKGFEDADEAGLSAKVDVASKEKVRKRIPKDAVHFGGHRYLLVDAGASWLTAKKDAERLGGHLVQLDSLQEHDFLISYIRQENPQNHDEHVWIDASRLMGGEDYRNSAGEVVDLEKARCTQFVQQPKTGCFLGMCERHGWAVIDLRFVASAQCAYIIEWDD